MHLQATHTINISLGMVATHGFVVEVSILVPADHFCLGVVADASTGASRTTSASGGPPAT